jgi:biotin operon repressor
LNTTTSGDPGLDCSGGVDKPVEASEPQQRRQRNGISKQYQTREQRMKRILELNKAGKTAGQISRALNIPSTTVLRDLKVLKKQGFEVNDNSKTYFENTKWYKIIERTNKKLNFYRERGIVPTLRKMTYRLIELGVLEKKDYGEFSKKTAGARRGVDSKYTRITKLPRLPIDCFRDDKRIVIGQTDVDEEPIQPTPAEPPEDPDDYISNEIKKLKQAPDSRYLFLYHISFCNNLHVKINGCVRSRNHHLPHDFLDHDLIPNMQDMC